MLKQESSRELTLKACPRCSEKNTVGVRRCIKCGYVIDEQVAVKTAEIIENHWWTYQTMFLHKGEIFKDNLARVFTHVAKSLKEVVHLV